MKKHLPIGYRTAWYVTWHIVHHSDKMGIQPGPPPKLKVKPLAKGREFKATKANCREPKAKQTPATSGVKSLAWTSEPTSPGNLIFWSESRSLYFKLGGGQWSNSTPSVSWKEVTVSKVPKEENRWRKYKYQLRIPELYWGQVPQYISTCIFWFDKDRSVSFVLHIDQV